LKDNLVNGCCLLNSLGITLYGRKSYAIEGNCLYSVGALSDLSNDPTLRTQFLHLFDKEPTNDQPPSKNMHRIISHIQAFEFQMNYF
jgi:hypothetical protein